MQTFLPYPSFAQSAACLDNRRLGKQRSETLQILKALTIPTYGWRHHPAVKMWRGYIPALVQYGVAMCEEWKGRGYIDNTHPIIAGFLGTEPNDLASQTVAFIPQDAAPDPALPPWFGDPDFHRSHQSNLLRKDPAHYTQFFPDIPDDLPYIWPTP
jgi:hypothetical protein